MKCNWIKSVFAKEQSPSTSEYPAVIYYQGNEKKLKLILYFMSDEAGMIIKNLVV